MVASRAVPQSVFCACGIRDPQTGRYSATCKRPAIYPTATYKLCGEHLAMARAQHGAWVAGAYVPIETIEAGNPK